jgi:hypothetical protein
MVLNKISTRDNSWKTAPSPITFSSIYGGEDYNANLEQKGWDMPNFDESLWRNAIVVEGHTRLSPQLTEPVKIMESFQPIQQKQVASGDWVFDLGQNASGIIELKVKGTKAIQFGFDLQNYSMPMVLSTKKLLEVPIFLVMYSKEKASKHGNHALAIMVFDIYK